MKCPWIPLLLGLAVFSACEDDSAVVAPAPEGLKPWDIVGRVVDARGTPIPGAVVNFTYTVIIDRDTLVTPLKENPVFTLGPIDSFLIEVFDHRDRLIWDKKGESGSEAFWDGLNFSGQPVVDGPYLVRLTAYSGSTTETINHWVAVVRDAETRALIAEATTDSEGRFHAPIRDLPIWKTYPGDSGPIAYGSVIGVFAFRGDGSLQHDLETVDLSIFPTQAVFLQIPDP